ncbi:helix-turn-helix domain-containing protein [Paraburkholderia dioscoreae]|uniref:DNA-binding helix-turn-helix protein n=1 Tax=Paraburkholderia dioscoreae TaxID=2604047 RepID=A0A5Q4Z2G5_9BURK
MGKLKDLRDELTGEFPEAKEGYDDRDQLVRLGLVLRQARRSLDLTQMQAADRSGIAQADISRLENGEGDRGPTFETLARYARALGLTLGVTLTPNGHRELASTVEF